MSRSEEPIVYIVVCAAVPARQVQQFVLLAQAAHWDVYVVATPNSLSFVDVPLLERITTHPVVYAYPQLANPSVLPPCAAIVVVPATFNTLRKWAQGRPDTFAQSLLCTNMESHVPILVVPRASPELAREPDFVASLAYLRKRGVYVLYDPARYPPNNDVSWPIILNELYSML